MLFFQILGIAVAGWLGLGLAVGVAFVATRPALFFSAGFRWGAMLQSVLFSAILWPLHLRQILGGDRRDAERAERDSRNASRIAAETYRFESRDGAWYRDVLGVHRKWLVRRDGTPDDPRWIGPRDQRVDEADFPCRNGAWTEGPCDLCGAPEKGASACGMRPTEHVGVPQYTPRARPMRHAPEEGFVLAVSNDDLGKSFVDAARDRFHVVAFRRTEPGRGVWVDRDGAAVDGLLGWWHMPEMDEVQCSDGFEEPARWTGDSPPDRRPEAGPPEGEGQAADQGGPGPRSRRVRLGARRPAKVVE